MKAKCKQKTKKQLEKNRQAHQPLAASLAVPTAGFVSPAELRQPNPSVSSASPPPYASPGVAGFQQQPTNPSVPFSCASPPAGFLSSFVMGSQHNAPSVTAGFQQQPTNPVVHQPVFGLAQQQPTNPSIGVPSVPSGLSAPAPPSSSTCVAALKQLLGDIDAKKEELSQLPDKTAMWKTQLEELDGQEKDCTNKLKKIQTKIETIEHKIESSKDLEDELANVRKA